MNSSRSRFSSSKRGYASEEVDDFLQTYVGPLKEEPDAAKLQVHRLQEELSEARELDDAMQITLLAATKTKDQFAAEAGQHRNSTVTSTVEEAETLLADARREAFATLQRANADAGVAISRAADEARALVAAATKEAEQTSATETAKSEVAQEEIEELRKESLDARAAAEKARDDAELARDDTAAAVAAASAAVEQAATSQAEAESVKSVAGQK